MSGTIHSNGSTRRALAAAVEARMNDALELVDSHPHEHEARAYFGLAMDLVILHAHLNEPRRIVDGPVGRATKPHRRPHRRYFK